MKKYLFTLLVSFFIVSLSSCTKDDSNTDPEPDPDPVKTYNVLYELSVIENSGDVEISWFESGNVKKEETNPSMPFKKEYTNFKSEDSVSFEFNISLVPGTKLKYTWEASYSGPDGADGLGPITVDLNVNDTTPAIVGTGSWKVKIP
ncbi:MAG: hypothetical protein QM503_03080 [Bacteroidota bacterium]